MSYFTAYFTSYFDVAQEVLAPGGGAAAGGRKARIAQPARRKKRPLYADIPRVPGQDAPTADPDTLEAERFAAAAEAARFAERRAQALQDRAQIERAVLLAAREAAAQAAAQAAAEAALALEAEDEEFLLLLALAV